MVASKNSESPSASTLDTLKCFFNISIPLFSLKYELSSEVIVILYFFFNSSSEIPLISKA